MRRFLLSNLPNTKFNRREKLYKELDAVLQHVGDQEYSAVDASVQEAIRTFARNVGMSDAPDEQQLHQNLQIIRQSLIDAGTTKLEKNAFLRTNQASSSRGQRAPTVPPAATAHDDAICLSTGIRELQKLGSAAQLGKQIRQLLVELGADAAIIGHTTVAQ